MYCLESYLYVCRINKKMNILPEDYDENYYLEECDGFKEYLKNTNEIPQRLQALMKIADIRRDMKILDVGCGRGEIIRECIREGVFAIGIDYSMAAIKLAKKSLINKPSMNNTFLLLGDVNELPFERNYFDRVIMSDVVEHLEMTQLKKALYEIQRILKPGGKLIIHTMPNLWYYRYGYPIFRKIERLRNVHLPSNPRDRYKYPFFHINEQTPLSLYKILRNVDFTTKIFLYDYRKYKQYPSVMRIAMRIVTSMPIIKLIFCDDIFAIATKDDNDK